MVQSRKIGKKVTRKWNARGDTIKVVLLLLVNNLVIPLSEVRLSEGRCSRGTKPLHGKSNQQGASSEKPPGVIYFFYMIERQACGVAGSGRATTSLSASAESAAARVDTS